ncbi:unnamed protein product [Arctogadus glacialis]
MGEAPCASLAFKARRSSAHSHSHAHSRTTETFLILHERSDFTHITTMLRSDVFSCFVFYAVLLILKMYFLAILTGQLRLRKKAFANPEDAVRHGGLEFFREDPDVERCRRAHLNDLENILPFLFLGAVYSLTGPSLPVARLHFLVFLLCRVLHSAAYLLPLTPPTRSVAYVLGQVPCVSMALQVLVAVVPYA